MNLEHFQRSVSKLKSLLDNPQLGLFTWHGFVNEAMEEIAIEYYGLNHEQIRKVIDANKTKMARRN